MRIILMIAFAFMLASCGGGGDNTGGSGSSGTPSGNDDAMGNMPLDMTSDEIAAALAQIQGRADARLWSELVMRDGTRHNTATLGNDYTFAGATYDVTMVHNGVHVTEGQSEHEVDGVCCQRTLLLGGWMEHGFFFGQNGVVLRDGEPTGSGFARVFSFGDATGSTPTGSGTATWRGVMIGGHLRERIPYQGDATITADFGDGNVDVAFTDIHVTSTGAAIDSIMFDDVPFTATGFSSGGTSGNWIAGDFYGPDHAEAGGVFEHETTMGAFGAKRADK